MLNAKKIQTTLGEARRRTGEEIGVVDVIASQQQRGNAMVETVARC